MYLYKQARPPMSVWILWHKTTKSVAVKIVEPYRNAQGQTRQCTVRYMGSVLDGKPLQALPQPVYIKKARLQKETQPVLFPAESYVKELLERGWTQAHSAPHKSGFPE